MLALVLACSISAGGARAQVNNEYNFHRQYVADGQTFTNTGDPTPILTMDCLAANGYGQWTLSSSAGTGSYLSPDEQGTITGTIKFPSGWYLLSNGLFAPSTYYDPLHPTIHSGCYPPGVVQVGTLLDHEGGNVSAPPAEPEATANLDGAVNFIWPDPSDYRNQFVVNFFQTPDFDLSGSFCINPTINSMKVITNGIHQTTVTTTSQPIDDTAKYYQDEYDRTSDAHYLYVVWESNNEIWATVHAIGSNTQEPGYPTMVGNGIRPTVACDARNNRGSGSFSPQFDVAYIQGGLPFDMSYSGEGIPTVTSLPMLPSFTQPCGDKGSPSLGWVTHARAMVSQIAGQTTATHGLYVIAYPSTNIGGGPTNEEALFLYTNLNSNTISFPTYCDGPLLPLDNYTDGVDNGIIDDPITAICDPYDNQNDANPYDCFHCVYRVNAQALYSESTISIVPLLIMKSIHNGGCNPYTSSDDTRLALNDVFIDPSPNPGYVAAVNQMGIHVHWRTGTTGSGTHYYSRDANQTLASDHHFSRAFDEPIEENTLVTDVCTVADGTAHGGTTVVTLQPGKSMMVWTDPNYGAAYGWTNTWYGLYQPIDQNGNEHPPMLVYNTPSVGTLQFSNQSGVTLAIGDGTSGANLSVMPNFYVFFPYNSQSLGQSLKINAGSKFDFYGLWGRNDEDESDGETSSTYTFGCAQFTRHPGSPVGAFSVRAGEGLVDLEGTSNNLATLVVHGGADFHIGVNGYFLSDYGDIEIENERNIFPLETGGGTNPYTNGLMTFEGQVTLNHTQINAHTGAFDPSSPSWSNYMVIHVPGTYEYPSTYSRPNGAFKSTYTSFNDFDKNNGFDLSGNQDPLAFAVLQFDQNTLADQIGMIDGGGTGSPSSGYSPYLHVSSNHDNFNNFSIEAVDPQVTDADIELSLTNANFNLDNYGDLYNSITNTHTFLSQDYVKLLKQDNTDYPNYGYLYLNGNTFYPRATGANTTSNHLNIVGFNTIAPTSFDNTDVLAVLNLIDIDGNYFYQNGVTSSGTSNGINLNESNSMTQNNYIYSALTNGIGVSGINTALNFSYLCTNTIGSASLEGPSVGILTSYYQGYINSDVISYAGIGTSSGGIGVKNAAGGNDNVHNYVPHLVGTTIYNCRSYGIEVDGGVIDLSGCHHNGDISGVNDFAGYNTIYSNSYSGSTSGQISLQSTANVWLTQNDFPSTWSVAEGDAGNNNIYQGTSSSPILIHGVSGNNPVDISYNYWGSGIDPQSSSPSTYWPGYHFSAASPAASQVVSGLNCGSNGDITAKPKGVKPLAISSDTDTCSTTFPTYVSELDQNFMFRQAYDTMRYWYIPHCYPIAIPQSAAGALEGSVQIGEDMNSVDSMLNFRSFVIHCLTLRNDDEWFCSFVADLVGTYTDSNSVHNPDYRADRTILQYLMNNPRCAAGYSGDSTEYWQLLVTQYGIWQDTAHGKAQFDSTVPTMHDLGLDTVLIINAGSDIVYPTQTSTIILDARLEGNPTDNGGMLWLSIGREAYLHINVYDVLGRQVQNAGYQGTFEQGSREIPLGMEKAPSGTYYIRIQTANNETQTLKLVKE